MRADADGATTRGGGALSAQRSAGAGLAELGSATAAGGRADRGDDPAGTAGPHLAGALVVFLQRPGGQSRFSTVTSACRMRVGSRLTHHVVELTATAGSSCAATAEICFFLDSPTPAF
ncbi:MAG: hypothetical protein ACRDRO_15890 [Pseudonocardiaceae bacterium]